MNDFLRNLIRTRAYFRILLLLLAVYCLAWFIYGVGQNIGAMLSGGSKVVSVAELTKRIELYMWTIGAVMALTFRQYKQMKSRKPAPVQKPIKP